MSKKPLDCLGKEPLPQKETSSERLARIRKLPKLEHANEEHLKVIIACINADLIRV